MSNKLLTSARLLNGARDHFEPVPELRHRTMTVSTQSSGPWRGYFEKVRAPHISFGSDLLDDEPSPDRWIVELVCAGGLTAERFVVGGHLEVGRFPSRANIVPALARPDWAALSGHSYRHPVDAEWIDEISEVASRRVVDESFPGRLTVDLVVTDDASSLLLARISTSVLSALLFTSLTTSPFNFPVAISAALDDSETRIYAP